MWDCGHFVGKTMRTDDDDTATTQGQFLSKVQLVWIQSFPSPRLVALSVPLVGGKREGYMIFLRKLVQWRGNPHSLELVPQH